LSDRYVPTLGSESASPEDVKEDPAKAPAGTNLCTLCVHPDVCAILTAARVLMPEGGFEVSSCALFFPAPKDAS
jgi:hypothetical protein